MIGAAAREAQLRVERAARIAKSSLGTHPLTRAVYDAVAPGSPLGEVVAWGEGGQVGGAHPFSFWRVI
jgi:hypothetical protein